MFRFGLSLFEAMEMVFPPIFSEMERMPAELSSMYTWFRRFLTASAQGPAAIIARHGSQCVFSVDAMGLRPLWFGETEKELFISSELGVVPHEEIMSDPKPLAPGEKVGLEVMPGKGVRVLFHPELRRHIHERFRKRTNLSAHSRSCVRVVPCRSPVAPGIRGGAETRGWCWKTSCRPWPGKAAMCRICGRWHGQATIPLLPSGMTGPWRPSPCPGRTCPTISRNRWRLSPTGHRPGAGVRALFHSRLPGGKTTFQGTDAAGNRSYRSPSHRGKA